MLSFGRNETVAFSEASTRTTAPVVWFTSTMPWLALGLSIQLCTTAGSRATVTVCVPVTLGRRKLRPASTSVPWPSAPGVFQLAPAPVCSQPRSVPGATLHGTAT